MKLIYYPDPILRKPSEPVRQIDADLRRVAKEMLQVMYEAKGLGLAAQQVGLVHRMTVMNVTGQAEDERVYINPTLVSQKGLVEAEEGCLSFPELYVKIRRAKQVTVRAYDLDGRELKIEAAELAARAWQHEIDHLDGVLFIDRMSETGRLAAAPRLKELEEAYEKARQRDDVA